MKGIEVDKTFLKGARLYIKKPTPIQAVQIMQTFWVKTMESAEGFQGKEGDYLIRGIRGEVYICDKEIFEESYTLFNK